jgi:hypothetical protein
LTGLLDNRVEMAGDMVGFSDYAEGQYNSQLEEWERNLLKVKGVSKFILCVAGCRKPSCDTKIPPVEEVRFSKRKSTAAKSLVPSQETLEAILKDPALARTRLSIKPIFSPFVSPDKLGWVQVKRRGEALSVVVGPSSFSSKAEVIKTIIHEEAHMRVDMRTVRRCPRVLRLTTGEAEDAYVESVAQRFWRMHEGK